jgi:rhodanese-related sulfurtransferase
MRIQNKMQHTNEFIQLVEECRPSIKEIDVHVLHDKLNKGQIKTLIDVREDYERVKGYIPNSIHLSRGIIERDILNMIPQKNEEIYLYCGGGFRSILSAYNLQKMGYTNVVSIAGGIRDWLDSGYKLTV